jgi:hypothetical protein
MGLPIIQSLRERTLMPAAQSGVQVGFDLHGSDSLARPALQRYIAQQFARVHQAHVTRFMPLLLQMHPHRATAIHNSPVVHGGSAVHEGCADAAATQGVVGLNPGCSGEMFLELYLDSPIEQSVAGVVGQPIDRASLIEIGNLAVSQRGSGLLLFVIMTCALQAAGYQWMVFTATREVEKLIRRLGYVPTCVATASAAKLGDEAHAWGRYYATNPRVMLGNLADAARVLRTNPRLDDLFARHEADIQRLAQSLRDQRRLSKCRESVS